MFNIQLFGDNDTLTSVSTLTMEYDIANNKTQKVTLQNPRQNLNETVIKNVMNADLADQIFVDRAQNDIVLTSDTATIATAYSSEQTTRDLDLT